MQENINVSIPMMICFLYPFSIIDYIFCVSHLPLKRLKFRYKKGVENASSFYLYLRSWRTYATDKTIAPHRFAIYFANLDKA